MEEKKGPGRPKKSYKRGIKAEDFYKVERRRLREEKTKVDDAERTLNQEVIFSKTSSVDKEKMARLCKYHSMTRTDFVRQAIRNYIAELLKVELRYKDFLKSQQEQAKTP